MPDDIFQSDDQHRRLSMRVKKDVFYEMAVYSTASSHNLLQTLYTVFMVLSGAASLVLLFLSGLRNYYLLTVGIVFGALCAIFYMMSQGVRVEYDYTFTNGILDIAKITNDKNRKKIVSIDVASEILEMKPITADSFQRFFEDKSVKKVNIFLNKGTHLYYMHINHEGKKYVIVFEPDGQLAEYIKMYNPDNVHL